MKVDPQGPSGFMSSPCSPDPQELAVKCRHLHIMTRVSGTVLAAVAVYSSCKNPAPAEEIKGVK